MQEQGLQERRGERVGGQLRKDNRKEGRAAGDKRERWRFVASSLPRESPRRPFEAGARPPSASTASLADQQGPAPARASEQASAVQGQEVRSPDSILAC